MDESLQIFIEEIGFATSRTSVPDAAFDLWRGRLPDLLLSCWKDEGWCGYSNGLVWITDPSPHEELVDEWLDGTGLDEIDAFHLIARSAFGDLYLCGERSGCSATVSCALGSIIALPNDLRPKSPVNRDNTFASLLLGNKSDFDLLDSTGTPLFDRALHECGPLGPDEVYGFEPAIVLGGMPAIANLKKLALTEHLLMLRQLRSPTLSFSRAQIASIVGA